MSNLTAEMGLTWHRGRAVKAGEPERPVPLAASPCNCNFKRNELIQGEYRRLVRQTQHLEMCATVIALLVPFHAAPQIVGRPGGLNPASAVPER